MNWYESPWNPFYFGRYQTELGFKQIGLPVLLGTLVWMLVAKRHGKPGGYLLCICLLVLYLWAFAAVTVFPFPTHFHIDGFPMGSLHLIPALIEGTDPEFRIGNAQVWGNFVAGVPFGMLVPFVASTNHATLTRISAWGLAFALAPELVQLLQNALFDEFSGRAVDIDDVWLCFTGTLVGYGLLFGVARLYRRLNWTRAARLPIWAHFHEVLMRVAAIPAAVSSAIPKAHAQ